MPTSIYVNEIHQRLDFANKQLRNSIIITFQLSLKSFITFPAYSLRKISVGSTGAIVEVKSSDTFHQFFISQKAPILPIGNVKKIVFRCRFKINKFKARYQNNTVILLQQIRSNQFILQDYL